MLGDDGRERRYRPIRDLSPFELAPLLGAGASAADLKRLAATLAESFSLEMLTDGAWLVVGCTGREDRAREWVEQGGEPDVEDCEI